MDLNTTLSNLIEIVVLIVGFGVCGVLFAHIMSLADVSTRHEDDYEDDYEDEDDDLFEDDEFTEMDLEDEAELQHIK